MTRFAIISIFFVLCAWTIPLHAIMTSTNFTILEDGISAVETVTSTGGNFSLFDFSDTNPGTHTQGDFILHGGFYSPDSASSSSSTSFSFSVTPVAIALGTLSQSSVSSDSLTATASTGSTTGYTVSISEDGNLRSGSNDINDVTDGTVTAGSEEYGIRTTGSSGLLASDTAISGTVNVITASSAVSNDSTTVTFRASIAGTSKAGSYSHIVTFTGTVNP